MSKYKTVSAVSFAALLGVSANCQTNSEWGKMMWSKYGDQSTQVTAVLKYKMEYAGAPITEYPTNSFDAVTNIVIGTNYTGTVQIGTNIWTMNELGNAKPKN